MKMSDFDSMADEPVVYSVDYRRLFEAELILLRDNVDFRIKYSDLRTQLLDEGLAESCWDTHYGSLKTAKATYSKPLHIDDLGAMIWQLLYLDCQVTSKSNSNIARVSFFLYDTTRTDDFLETSDSFFALAEHKIVDERFAIFASAPEDNPSEVLVRNGIWTMEVPVGDRDLGKELWLHEKAWRIGWLRAAYSQFYNNTDYGRAQALAPGTKRLDSVAYWLDDDSAIGDLGKPNDQEETEAEDDKSDNDVSSGSSRLSLNDMSRDIAMLVSRTSSLASVLADIPKERPPDLSREITLLADRIASLQRLVRIALIAAAVALVTSIWR